LAPEDALPKFDKNTATAYMASAYSTLPELDGRSVTLEVRRTSPGLEVLQSSKRRISAIALPLKPKKSKRFWTLLSGLVVLLVAAAIAGSIAGALSARGSAAGAAEGGRDEEETLSATNKATTTTRYVTGSPLRAWYV
jgi:hypothetical protein